MTQTDSPRRADTSDRFLQAALQISDRLMHEALWDGIQRCNWQCDAWEAPNGQWQVVNRTCGLDLYGGTSSIALFLIEQSGEQWFLTAARGAFNHALSKESDIPGDIAVSFYSGRVGIAYALLEFGRVSRDTGTTDRGLTMLSELIGQDPGSWELDVVSGCATAIPVLLGVGTRYARPEFIALVLGRYLVRNTEHNQRSAAWRSIHPEPAMPPLLGFAHGAAGISWVLLELFAATGDRQYLDVAADGFRYEQSWFNPAQCNWPDLREPEDGSQEARVESYPTQWRHGAPGIGLSRLRAYELTGDPVYLSEAQASIRTVRASLLQAIATPPRPSAFEQNFSLCHGLAGNAELLIDAVRVLHDPDLLSVAYRVADFSIHFFGQPRRM